MKKFALLLLVLFVFMGFVNSAIPPTSNSGLQYFDLCPKGQQFELELDGHDIDLNPEPGTLQGSYPQQFEADGPLSHNGGATATGPNNIHINVGDNAGKNNDLDVDVTVSSDGSTVTAEGLVQGVEVSGTHLLTGKGTKKEPYEFTVEGKVVKWGWDIE